MTDYTGPLEAIYKASEAVKIEYTPEISDCDDYPKYLGGLAFIDSVVTLFAPYHRSIYRKETNPCLTTQDHTRI